MIQVVLLIAAMLVAAALVLLALAVAALAQAMGSGSEVVRSLTLALNGKLMRRLLRLAEDGGAEVIDLGDE